MLTARKFQYNEGRLESAQGLGQKRKLAELGIVAHIDQLHTNTLANTTASDPHAGLVLDMRVSTVVYPI